MADMTVNVRSRLAAASLIASLGLMAVVPIEHQSTPVRRYSKGGLEIDLPGDWQLAEGSSDGWNLVFRSAATRGEIEFIVWLPMRESHYPGSFEGFVKSHLKNVKGMRVKRLQGSGFRAVSLSWREVQLYRGQPHTLEPHETWIGVPDGKAGVTVFRFFTTLEPSGPRREAELMAYQGMLASMRIDPVTFLMRR
jgi:hypothetical protein